MGQTNYLAGLSAEDSVRRLYEKNGYQIIRQRFRGTFGEIDIIARNADTTVFVEVKKSTSFEQAASRVSKGQVQRLFKTAEQYLASTPGGICQDARFDVVLLNAQGEHEVLENALCA